MDMSIGPSAATPEQEDGGLAEGVDNYLVQLRDKILFCLDVYPFLSPTMIHTFLGTATPSKVWKPILGDLIAEGLVVSEEVHLTSPHGRNQSYTVIHLNTKNYVTPSNENSTACNGKESSDELGDASTQ